MGLATEVIKLVVLVFLVCVFGRMLLSYFPLTPGSPMSGLQSLTVKLSEPVLAPLRRLLPPIGLAGGTMLDLSPIIVAVVCLILLELL